MKRSRFLILLLVALQIIFLTLRSSAQTPDFLWTRQIEATFNTWVYGIGVDDGGNSYVTGSFAGTTTIGSTTLVCPGFSAVFIAKYDPAGNVLWARQAGRANHNSGTGIAVDGSGNCYITGNFSSDSITFGHTTLANSANGVNEVFVAKYDTQGNPLWARSAGGSGADMSTGIAVDDSGNSYVTGSVGSAAAAFGSTTLSTEGAAMFIAKYDPAGNVLWAKQSLGSDGAFGSCIAADRFGNSWVSGYFDNAATFGNTTLSGGVFTMFIARYDAAGNVQWAGKAGGLLGVFSNGIDVDGAGNSYVTGWFSADAIFGATTLTNGTASFITKYDSAGNVRWARQSTGSIRCKSSGIAVDGSGNSCITGTYLGPAVSFGSTTLTGYPKDNTFIAWYDTAGAVLWANQSKGQSNDGGTAVAIDGTGNCYVTGNFRDSVTFGTTALIDSLYGTNVFLTKLGLVNGLPQRPEVQAVAVHPNPFAASFNMLLPQPATAPVSVRLIDFLGREIYRQQLPAGNTAVTVTPQPALAPGLYLLQVQSGQQRYVQKVVVE